MHKNGDDISNAPTIYLFSLNTTECSHTKVYNYKIRDISKLKIGKKKKNPEKTVTAWHHAWKKGFRTEAEQEAVMGSRVIPGRERKTG